MLLKLFSPTSVAIPSVAANEAAERAAKVVVSSSCARPHWVMMNPPLSMIKAVAASLLRSKSCMALFSSLTSSSMSCGSVGIRRLLLGGVSGDLALAFGDELLQEHARDHIKCLKHTFALVRTTCKCRDLLFTIVQQIIQKLNRSDVGKIAFVILDYVR